GSEPDAESYPDLARLEAVVAERERGDDRTARHDLLVAVSDVHDEGSALQQYTAADAEHRLGAVQQPQPDVHVLARLAAESVDGGAEPRESGRRLAVRTHRRVRRGDEAHAAFAVPRGHSQIDRRQ